MKKIPLLFLLTIFCISAFAQKNLPDGPGLLFKNIKTRLTILEKKQVFEKTGFGLSADKKQFILAGDLGSSEFPFDATVLPTDINNDGKEDVFIIFGNTYTSGMAGSNVLLFIKDKAGKYQPNFGFSGASPVIMPIRNLGYPDLIIGGPGLVYPVWRWNGKEYVFNRKIADNKLSKIKVQYVDAASKAYVSSIK